jgi:GT2 family glycosyltransferase
LEKEVIPVSLSIPVAIVPVLNRFDLLDGLLDSMDYPIDNLLVIDNSGSYKFTRSELLTGALEKTKVHVLNMPANMGVAGSWNLGIKCFPHAPYWLIMSNDNHWEPGSLAEMQRLSSSENLVMSNNAWNAYSLGAEIVKTVGLFDENYHPAYYEDTDYMERMRLLGVKDQIIWSTIPLRSVGASLTLHSDERFTERNAYTNQQNYEYWNKKINIDQTHLSCSPYDLGRRIRHEWLL